MNISIDNEIGAQAQDVFASLGLDMNEAVDLFLRQTIRQRNIPFDVAVPMQEFEEQTETVPIELMFGCMKGKIWMSDDFDAPMEEFEEDEEEDEEEFFAPQHIVPQPGCMRGEIWMADDFDAPMEEFAEYM